MPIGIGIRADNKAIHYAILSGDKDTPICLASGLIKYPKACTLAEVAVYCREQLALLLEVNKVERCGLRTPEPSGKIVAPKIDQPCRLHVEGALLTAIGDKRLPVRFFVQASMKSCLGPGGKSPKGYIEAGEFRGIAAFAQTGNDCLREAILVGTCLLD